MTIDRNSAASTVVQWCQAHALPGELVGRWVWVFFAEKPAPETLATLKESGFRFSRPNGDRPAGWYHTGGTNSGRRRPVKGCDARATYGAIPVGELVAD